MTDFQLLLAAIGLTFILKYGFILNVPRDWLKGKSVYFKELLSCSQCLGFWCGLSIYFLANCLTGKMGLDLFVFSIFAGFINSFVASTVDMLIDFLDEKVVELRQKNKRNGRGE